MIFWMIPIFIAFVFLSWMLISALKQYENKNAASALKQAEALKERLNELEGRLENLEAIESDSILIEEKGKEMPDSAESLSLGREPISG